LGDKVSLVIDVNPKIPFATNTGRRLRRVELENPGGIFKIAKSEGFMGLPPRPPALNPTLYLTIRFRQAVGLTILAQSTARPLISIRSLHRVSFFYP